MFCVLGRIDVIVIVSCFALAMRTYAEALSCKFELIQSLRGFRRTDLVSLCIGSLVFWCRGCLVF